MKVFIEKVGGKYCPSFKFLHQTFHLKGYDTEEEAEWMTKQLKACFSNYGLLIIKNHDEKLLKQTVKKLKEVIEQTNKAT